MAGYENYVGQAIGNYMRSQQRTSGWDAILAGLLSGSGDFYRAFMEARNRKADEALQASRDARAEKYYELQKQSMEDASARRHQSDVRDAANWLASNYGNSLDFQPGIPYGKDYAGIGPTPPGPSFKETVPLADLEGQAKSLFGLSPDTALPSPQLRGLLKKDQDAYEAALERNRNTEADNALAQARFEESRTARDEARANRAETQSAAQAKRYEDLVGHYQDQILSSDPEYQDAVRKLPRLAGALSNIQAGMATGTYTADQGDQGLAGLQNQYDNLNQLAATKKADALMRARRIANIGLDAGGQDTSAPEVVQAPPPQQSPDGHIKETVKSPDGNTTTTTVKPINEKASIKVIRDPKTGRLVFQNAATS